MGSCFLWLTKGGKNEMESIPVESAVKIFKMRAKNIQYFINLFDKVVGGFERTDSSFEINSIVDKMLSNSTTDYRETIHKSENQLIWPTSFSEIISRT